MVEPVVLLDGRVTLYLGDCREILPTLGKVDAVVTDPPYGIGVDVAMHKQGGTQYGRAAAAKRHYAATDWDAAPIDREDVARMASVSRWQVIFGGNYFDLPSTRCWLIWDKENGSNAFADCEMAWTNLDKPVRKLSWMWNGMLRKGGEPRGEHPTQKPLGVMRWAIEQLPPEAMTILDPYAGSGTTGVAAFQLGKRFIGIEREPVYFDVMRRRIEEASKQADLFIDPAPAPKQKALAL